MADASTSLNLIQDTNTTAIKGVVDGLGALADIAGGVGAIVTVIDFIIGANQHATQSLGDIQKMLKQEFALLNARVKADSIARRESELNDAYREADSVMGTLKADVLTDPPLPWGIRSLKIGQCISAVDTFDYQTNAHLWQTFFPDEIYYQDWWSGKMMPEPDADLTVFTDRYTLPEYLRILYIFIAVIRAFDERYRTNYTANVSQYINNITDVHDVSAAGVRLMPLADEQGATCQWSGGDGGTIFLIYLRQDSEYRENTPWMGATPRNGDINGTPGLPSSAYFNDNVKLFQPFGAVHLYSGYSAFGKFPPVPNLGRNASPFPPPQIIYDRFRLKSVIAAHGRRKDVYRGVGLSAVRDAIDALGEVLGKARLTPDTGRWWSLRETAYLLDPVHAASIRWVSEGYINDPKDARWFDEYKINNALGARDVLGRLFDLSPHLPPDPPDATSLSWRNALDRALLRNRVDPQKWW